MPQTSKVRSRVQAVSARLDKLNKYMAVAETIAQQFSHDDETKVGALMIHKETGAIISTGYNGFVREANDDELPRTRPDKYPYMKHAEENIFMNALRHGVCSADCYLVVTLSPCVNCLRLCWQAGIDTIFFRDTYRDFHKSSNMGDLNVECTKLGSFSMITLTGKR